MLVMVGVRTEAGRNRSVSDCLLGQLSKMLEMSDSAAGPKEDKLEVWEVLLDGTVSA